MWSDSKKRSDDFKKKLLREGEGDTPAAMAKRMTMLEDKLNQLNDQIKLIDGERSAYQEMEKKMEEMNQKIHAFEVAAAAKKDEKSLEHALHKLQAFTREEDELKTELKIPTVSDYRNTHFHLTSSAIRLMQHINSLMPKLAEQTFQEATQKKLPAFKKEVGHIKKFCEGKEETLMKARSAITNEQARIMVEIEELRRSLKCRHP